MADGCLTIDCADPSFVRCDTVIVNRAEHSVGLVLQEGYHHVGPLPKEMAAEALDGVTEAHLKALLPEGQAFCLKAPVKIT